MEMLLVVDVLERTFESGFTSFDILVWRSSLAI